MRNSALSWFLALGLVCSAAAPAMTANARQESQNQKKSKKEPDSSGIILPSNNPDAQAVDLLVSQMLGAWQIGDVDMMHKYYANDVVVVSGAWEPPLIGWDNFVRAYQAQRARTEGSHLDRSNSYTKVQGDTAWVTYQWQFSAEVDGQPMVVYGHTTLNLEKRTGQWLITLNHTSAVPAATPGSPAAVAH
jgi:ketosteroid isomerase-like protein